MQISIPFNIMMSNQQTIQRLAEFTFKRGKTISVDWNPLEDWNHWRQVEKKIMEDNELYLHYYRYWLNKDSVNYFWEHMKADLPTRCKALISVLPSTDE